QVPPAVPVRGGPLQDRPRAVARRGCARSGRAVLGADAERQTGRRRGGEEERALQGSRGEAEGVDGRGGGGCRRLGGRPPGSRRPTRCWSTSRAHTSTSRSAGSVRSPCAPGTECIWRAGGAGRRAWRGRRG